MDSTTFHCIIAAQCPETRRLVRDAIGGRHPKARVSETAHSDDAIQLYQRFGADLMVIGHQLPHSGGASLIRALRLNKAHIPLVLVADATADRHEASAAGATHLVEKEKIAESFAYYLPVWLPGK